MSCFVCGSVGTWCGGADVLGGGDVVAYIVGVCVMLGWTATYECVGRGVCSTCGGVVGCVVDGGRSGVRVYWCCIVPL